METDVLIVGAGPVGMTLALTLQRSGVSVVLVDREKEVGKYTRAALVWPRTLEILDQLGIAGQWREAGVHLNRFHFSIDSHLANVTVGENEGPFPQPLGIGQNVTEAFLDAAIRASGVDYRRGVEVTQVTVETDGASATLRDAAGSEASKRASWVVGCDGSRSLVRAAAGITRTGGQNAGTQLIQGDFRVQTSQTLIPGDVYLWSGANQNSALLLLPTTNEGHYRVMVAQADDGTHETPETAQIQKQARAFLPDLVLSDPLWRNQFRTQHQLADTYRSGRAFVAGDAAHVWVPIGGQGMNIGMQDAFDLGWKLAGVIRGELPEAVLDTYEIERRPFGARNIADTERLYGAIFNAHSWENALVRRLIPFAFGFPPVAEKASARLAGLDFQYSEGLLVAKNEGSGLKNGTRAPDAWVSLLPSGKTTRLYDLFRTPHWVALGWVLQQDDFADVPHTLEALVSGARFTIDAYIIDATKDGVAPVSTTPTLRDVPHLAVEEYRINHAGVCLIRPDGVIAWHGAMAASAQTFLSALDTT